MINFRPMAASEFDAYRAYFVPDYALDLMANHRLAKDAAFAQASEDLAQAFGSGRKWGRGESDVAMFSFGTIKTATAGELLAAVGSVQPILSSIDENGLSLRDNLVEL